MTLTLQSSSYSPWRQLDVTRSLKSGTLGMPKWVSVSCSRCDGRVGAWVGATQAPWRTGPSDGHSRSTTNAASPCTPPHTRTDTRTHALTHIHAPLWRIRGDSREREDPAPAFQLTTDHQVSSQQDMSSMGGGHCEFQSPTCLPAHILLAGSRQN